MFPKPHVNLNLPKLIKIKDIKVDHPEKPFSIGLFKLDWNIIDKMKFKEFHNFCISWNIDDIEEIYDRFPQVTSFNNLYKTDGMRFIINNDYLKQIRNNVLQAYNNEVNINVNNDTMIRDYCKKATEINIQIAFFLLADCLYDEKSNYFSRTDPIRLVTSSLLWRYWSFKTGRGLLRERCLINDLERNYENIFKNENILKYIQDFDDWLEKLNKAYDFIKATDENKTENQPSKGE